MTLLTLIHLARSSQDGVVRHRLAGTDRWLDVNTRDRKRTHYIYGSGFYEVTYLTRRAAANVCRIAAELEG